MFWSRQRSHFRWLAVVQVPDKTKVSRNRQRLLVGTYDSTAKIKARGERDAEIECLKFPIVPKFQTVGRTRDNPEPKDCRNQTGAPEDGPGKWQKASSPNEGNFHPRTKGIFGTKQTELK